MTQASLMMGAMVAAAVLLGAAALTAPGRADPINALHSPKVDMPTSDQMFPPGPGADAINDNCVTCHSADHVLNQPSLTREGWSEVVAKMINAYKAPVDAADAAQIIDYLARLKGKS